MEAIKKNLVLLFLTIALPLVLEAQENVTSANVLATTGRINENLVEVIGGNLNMDIKAISDYKFGYHTATPNYKMSRIGQVRNKSSFHIFSGDSSIVVFAADRCESTSDDMIKALSILNNRDESSRNDISRCYFNTVRYDLFSCTDRLTRSYKEKYNCWDKYDSTYLEKYSWDDLRKDVKYMPKSYAKGFNADTVIHYVKTYNDDDYVAESEYVNQIKTSRRLYLNHDDYIKSDVFVLIKNNSGVLFLYCFYTEKGYKNKKKHMEAMKKMFRFRN